MIIKHKKRLQYGMYFFVPVLLILLVPVQLPYSVKARAAFYPVMEWQLRKNSDGNLISVHKDNRKGSLETYSITEFQRGDVVTFSLVEGILQRGYIAKGDTIGTYNSNEERRKFIELTGQLGILKAELEYYTTGQKPEDVDEALHQLKLAKQQLSTEKKLMERSRILYRDSVISEQEFEIAENNLRVKEINLDIAEARYRSITTGEKPEQEQLLRAKIIATEDQLNQVNERLESLVLRSPVSGMVIHQHQAGDNRVMAIADTSVSIGMCALKADQRKLVNPGQEVYAEFAGKIHKGTVVGIDNSMQFIDGYSAFFVRVAFPHSQIPPGALVDVDIFVEDMRFFSYVGRLFGLI
jgi:hypothetical protein